MIGWVGEARVICPEGVGCRVEVSSTCREGGVRCDYLVGPGLIIWIRFTELSVWRLVTIF